MTLTTSTSTTREVHGWSMVELFDCNHLTSFLLVTDEAMPKILILASTLKFFNSYTVPYITLLLSVHFSQSKRSPHRSHDITCFDTVITNVVTRE